MTTTELIQTAQRCAELCINQVDCPDDCPFTDDEDCKNHIILQLCNQLQDKHTVKRRDAVAVAAYRAMRQALLKFDDSMPAGEILTYLDGVCETAEALQPALKPAKVIGQIQAGDW